MLTEKNSFTKQKTTMYVTSSTSTEIIYIGSVRNLPCGQHNGAVNVAYFILFIIRVDKIDSHKEEIQKNRK